MANYKRPPYNGTNNKSNFTPKEGNKFESKSFAEMQFVQPQEGQKFDPFYKIFAWKTTKRFGFISLEAYKNKEQKLLNGDAVLKGYEKWYIKLKTGITSQTISALYNTKKKVLFFDLGTTKCAISPSKNYFSFLMPEAVKNAKLRR